MPKKPAKAKDLKAKIKREIFFICSCCAVIVLLTLSSHNLSRYTTSPKVLSATRNIEQELTFWKTIVTETPSYRDGWLELARLEMELGDKSEARKYLNQAKTIDPNNSEVKELEAKLL